MSEKNWEEKVRNIVKTEIEPFQKSLKEMTSLLSEKTKPKEEKGFSFKDFLSKHIPDCPECQKVLSDAGYIKKEEVKEPEKWEVGKLFAKTKK